MFFLGKKEWKDNQIKQGRGNANKFFMRVLKERSETSCVDTWSVTATNTNNPFWDDVKPPTSTGTISVDYTDQERIPDIN